MNLCPAPRSTRPLAPGSVAVVLGTRPELVKLAPLIHELGPATRLVHTGQHWDEAMSGRFLRDLGLPRPELLTGVGGRPEPARSPSPSASSTPRSPRTARPPSSSRATPTPPW